MVKPGRVDLACLGRQGLGGPLADRTAGSVLHKGQDSACGWVHVPCKSKADCNGPILRRIGWLSSFPVQIILGSLLVAALDLA